MRTLGDSSYDDIAATLRTSPAAARQSVTSARRALRRRRLAGVLPIPAWIMELSSLASSGTSALSGRSRDARRRRSARPWRRSASCTPRSRRSPSCGAGPCGGKRAGVAGARGEGRDRPARGGGRSGGVDDGCPRTSSSQKTRAVAPAVRRPSQTTVGDDDDPPRDDENAPLDGLPRPADARMLARRAPSHPDAGGDAQDLSGEAAWPAPRDAAAPGADEPAATPGPPGPAAPRADAPRSAPQDGAMPAPPAP